MIQSAVFSPTLQVADPRAAYWLRQVTLRLRREVCWLWQERGMGSPPTPGSLPPYADPLLAALDLARFWEQKQAFFHQDVTAHYLSEELASPEPAAASASRGSFAWVLEQLAPAGSGGARLAAFLLALGLGPTLDSAMAPVISACQNDPHLSQPTLALAQTLWDEPGELLGLPGAAQYLFRWGLLQPMGTPSGGQPTAAGLDWRQPFSVPAPVARKLLFPDAALPEELALAGSTGTDNPLVGAIEQMARMVAARLLASEEGAGLRVTPVLGPQGAEHALVAGAIAGSLERPLLVYRGELALLENERYRNSLATLCWQHGVCLLVDLSPLPPAPEEHRLSSASYIPAHSIPLVLFLGLRERSQVPRLPDSCLLPPVETPPFGYAERAAAWQADLGPAAHGLEEAIAETARRFRYPRGTVQRISAGLRALGGPLAPADLTAACRAEMALNIGGLAWRSPSRFAPEQFILPPKQKQQFAELIQAASVLTTVHYRWGTAKTWNEAGITALFAGPPGTGKTMGAEILAAALDLPMYRIDLSQVVNKYIGETEKNLKHLFDAADQTDILLFFDEADSLFGKRTEVKDAHDRYANLEINYLLQRMENFNGLAILATNRKRDLDEAFLRRLRFIIDFPLPDAAQRRQIWQQVIPPGVDTSGVNFDFLARQFPLAGGHIQSIVFAACLQSARPGETEHKQLTMPALIRAVRREYDKLNRPISLEAFGPYARMVEEIERDDGKYSY